MDNRTVAGMRDAVGVSVLANTGISGDQTLDSTGQIWFGGWPSTLYKVASGAAAGTTPTTVDVSGNAFHTPLQATDGNSHFRTYLPRRVGLMMVYNSGGAIEWGYDPAPAIFRAAAMDCQGRYYVGVGDPGQQQTIYAFISDDRGLADTSWPSGRRDSRNSGNSTALKYGVRLTGGACAP